MRIVHYINQFFGQIGGEAEAYYPLEVREGIVGPGMALKAALGDDIQIVATIICGDNYFVENLEQTKKQVADTLKKYNVDLLVAGPAFNAGRYGMACGGACEAAYEAGVNAVSGMFEENPGIELYHKYGYIVYTDNNARGMRKAVESMAHLVKKMATGEEIKDSASEGYAMRGIRKNYFLEETGAERSINMLLKKINGESFETELPMPVFEKFEPSPAVNELSKATILVMTSGGMVPLGNPDHLEACNCTKFRKYSLEDDYCGKGVTKGQVVHGGYDPTYGNENGNRILPVDILFDMEKEGVIGKLYDNTFVTVGNGMGTDQAADFGDAIAQELKKDQIDGVILTSTWGTCTRCGATIAKHIDAAGIPIVHICTVTPISLSVGANRVVPAVSIPHPVGRPDLPKEAEDKERRKIIETALKALTTEIEDQTLFEVK